MLDKQFKMRVNKQEKRMFRYVSAHLQMNQTATVKTLVREVYQLIKAERAEQKKLNQEQVTAA